MIKINLLPHRALKRAARRRDFYVMAGASFAASVLIVIVGGVVISSYITTQANRNAFIKDANAKLDIQIAEIAQLRGEIDALKARKQAVENLQGDRNLPVHMLEELTRHIPEGIYLNSSIQDGMRVALNGYAQSNERIAELLRNLGNNSIWLERPELIEIRLVPVGNRRLFEFGVNVYLRRPNEKEIAEAAAKAAGAAGLREVAAAPATAPAVAAPAAAVTPAAAAAPKK